MHTKLIQFGVAVAVSAALLLPAAASAALSSGQIQSVTLLLQSFGVDQATVDSVSAALGGSVSSGSAAQVSCASLSYNLYAGLSDSTTNGDVTRLQQFLSVNPTGYFGPMTEQAVQAWQSSHSIVSSGSPDTTGYGFVGPQTRGAMACAGVVFPATSNTTTATTGIAPQIAFDLGTLTTPLANPVITGKAQGISQVRVDIYGHPSVIVVVTNGAWSATMNDNLGYGVYSIQAVDLSSGAVLATGALHISSTAAVPTVPATAPATTVPNSNVPGTAVTVTTPTYTPPIDCPQGSHSNGTQCISGTMPTATITASSLGLQSGGTYTVSGTAANTTTLLAYMIPTYYSGARDYVTLTKNLGGFVWGTIVSPVPVQKNTGVWFAYFNGAGPAGSVVAVFDSTSHALLAYGYVGGGTGTVSGGGENGGGETTGGSVGGDTSNAPGGPDFGGYGGDNADTGQGGTSAGSGATGPDTQAQ